MKRTIIAACLLLIWTCGASAETADPAKLAAAKRWYAAMPVEEMVEDALKYIAGFYPERARQKFYDIAYKKIDYANIETAVLQESSRIFTVKEMDALGRFYGTPEGKTIAAKLGRYLVATIPVVQVELFHAAQEAAEKLK